MNTGISSNLSSISKIQPSEGKSSNSLNSKVDSGGFKEALLKAGGESSAVHSTNIKPLTFKFSNHAVERMQKRGISFSPQEMQSIEKAVTDAEKKGSKEALIISDKSALIVSVKNKTVVTVMEKGGIKDNVFTNIDSTVII